MTKNNQAKFLAVNLKSPQGIYKLLSVITGTDKSVYVIYPNNKFIREKQGSNNIIPIKYSRHQSGNKCRFTLGPNRTRFTEFGESLKVKINEIAGSEGLIYLSLRNVNDDIEKMLDRCTSEKQYSNYLLIDSRLYKDLTIRTFLANKNFKIDNPSRNYKEIHVFNLGNLNLILTTEDKRMGSNEK